MLFFPLNTIISVAALFPAVDFPAILKSVEAAGEGRLTFAGGVYANRESDPPKRESRFESHRVFADIQIVLEGSEYIEVCPVSALESAPYDDADDISFYAAPDLPPAAKNHAEEALDVRKRTPAPISRIRMTPGNALLLLPEDAHKPCLFDGAWDAPIRKCVIKIPVELLEA